MRFGKIAAEALNVANTCHVDLLKLTVIEQQDDLLLECYYNEALYDEATVTSWLGGYRAILKGLADEKWLPAGILEFIDPRHEQMLNEFARGPKPPNAFRFSDLAKHASEQGSRQAASSPNKTASFRGLQVICSQVAALLTERDAGPAQCAAVLLPDPVHRLVTGWACLKAGFSFIPLPGSLAPQAQLKLATQAGADLLITNNQVARPPSWSAATDCVRVLGGGWNGVRAAFS